MPVEKVPAFGIKDKYVDALLSKPPGNLLVELSLLTIISRLNEVLPLDQLVKLLGVPEVQIEVGLYKLIEIGFLKKCDFTISN